MPCVDHFVGAPAKRTMVNYNVFGVLNGDGVVLFFGQVAAPHSQIAKNYVIGSQLDFIIFQSDAVAGSCLSGNSQVRIADSQIAFKFDSA
jgi:hypothetical protein